MEQDMFKVPGTMASHSDNPLVIDGVASTTTSNSHIIPTSFDFDKQEQINLRFPLHLTMQRDTIDSFDINHHITASMTKNDASAMALRPMLDRTVTRDTHTSLCLSKNSNLTGPYSASFATLLMTSSSLPNVISNVALPRPSAVLPDSARTSTSYDGSSTQSSKHSFLAGDAFMSTGLESSQFTQNLDTNKHSISRIANADVNQQNISLNYNKDLSLGLASSLPLYCQTNTKDHGCDTFCSVGSHNALTDLGFGSEKNSCHSTEISPTVEVNKRTQFSHIVPGSFYLQVIQDILAQIATYSHQTLDLGQISCQPSRAEAGRNIPDSSSWSHEREWPSHEHSDILNRRIEAQNDLAGRHSFESKKAQLLALLQVVDDCYSQCLDEMHTVVSAFHAATELDPNIHACFALHTVSSMYKDIRDRISKQILAVGATLHALHPREERSPETLCNERQWALQQLKGKDNQLWRPQRGLPERSVAVLKAWMFQNFLHPYPKDSEKHLLAIKSGLTRSQVSNWFINARVRIWKPLIEEMYSEINERKARQNKGAYGNYNGHMNPNNQS